MATVIMTTLVILVFAVVMIVAAFFDRSRGRQIEHDLHDGPTKGRA